MTDHGRNNALAWHESIVEMVESLRAAEAGSGHDYDEARERIEEAPLSVLIRDGWRAPGAPREAPAEYEILLTTGGPALRIVGDLGEHAEPETARLQYQDWGTSWTDYPEQDDEAVLAFARVFWFGE